MKRSAASSASWAASVVSAGIARVYVRGMRLRLVQLYGGLLLYGVSSSLLVLAGPRLDPWGVFPPGLSQTFGLPVRAGGVLLRGRGLLLLVPPLPRPGLGDGRH